MPPDLIIHPTTAQLLAAYTQRPPHAMLLTGPAGIGKLTIATAWAQQLSQPQTIQPDEKGSIGIETIRDLYRQSRARRQDHQTIIIDHAETMSIEAENALLKLLEEPRPGVTFVLCAPHTSALLPTIVSRAQQITVHPVDNQTLRRAIPAGTDTAQALFIARGRPGALMQLLDNPANFTQASEHMRQAKSLLTANQYERLCAITKLASHKTTCISILDAMLHMVSLQLKHATTDQLAQKWLQRQAALEACLSKIQLNGNLRAQLLRLFTSY